MKIIDSHAHLGDCKVFDANITESQLLETLDHTGVDGAIVQPYPGAADCVDVHNRIYRLNKEYPGRIYGVASINPHIQKEKYEHEVRRCIEELGFVGIKLHTIGHAVHPLSADARMVFEWGCRLKVPVIVHTGPGAPFALPSLCISIARKYPEITLVLAHSGVCILTDEAIVSGEVCDNIYLEMSWCGMGEKERAIKTLGSDRIMMGSDALNNIAPEIYQFRQLGLNEEDETNVLYKTAAAVFKL